MRATKADKCTGFYIWNIFPTFLSFSINFLNHPTELHELPVATYYVVIEPLASRGVREQSVFTSNRSYQCKQVHFSLKHHSEIINAWSAIAVRLQPPILPPKISDVPVILPINLLSPLWCLYVQDPFSIWVPQLWRHIANMQSESQWREQTADSLHA